MSPVHPAASSPSVTAPTTASAPPPPGCPPGSCSRSCCGVLPDFTVDAAAGEFADGHYVRRYARLPFTPGARADA